MIREKLQNKAYLEALEIIEKELQKTPEDVELNYYAAWANDSLGRETAAIPFYELALSGKLTTTDRLEAFIGLGSTYRVTGSYERAHHLLEQAIQEFPNEPVLQVFQAMVKYNQTDYKAAVSQLLTLIIQHASDKNIRAFERALTFYTQNLDYRYEVTEEDTHE